ncbi:hypothetical protein JMUB3936_p3002 (plasmid) [Leptotrichia wadei]|uniref:Lysozyme inhibitor LprI-like N-terminal domain-containing protein n=1 Tax=Leptotrichia wadei TaxID=157687 RepID=A0A510KWU7_9FUSO|nr:lysozyme inhibitor LprI family protein [Leptotrichia wadei]BBM56046.1 hypothetical protein JMUB3936_p3002 [Leptotrichia wadei]
MKKLALIIVILLIGVMNCSKSDKEEKTNENKTINAPVKSDEKKENSDEKKENYEAEIIQRMDVVKKEVQPALDSGVTADMNNAVKKLGDSWETEMKKVYELLLAELPENEKTKLQKEQEEWVKKVNTEPKEKKLEKTEKRAIEMAKRYDKIHKK